MKLKPIVCVLFLLLPAPVFSQATPVPIQHQELVQELLGESLQYELQLLAKENATHYGMRSVYLPQLDLRGRAGEFEQAQRLAAAILEKHEDRNLDRSKMNYEERLLRYRDLTTSADGLADLIQQGALEQVLARLQNTPQRKTDVEIEPFQREEFWLSCKLAVAYYKQGDLATTRDCLNLARGFREGEKVDASRSFDADDNWLPEMPEDTLGFGSSSPDQSRATFLATLVQTGHSELAIEWFLARHPLVTKEQTDSFRAFSGNTLRFIGWVARYSSGMRAIEVAEAIFGKACPPEIQAVIIAGGLEQGELAAVTKAVDNTIAGLADPSMEWGYGYQQSIESLVDFEKDALANQLLSALLMRLEEHVAARLESDNDSLKQSRWNDALSFRLAQVALTINVDTAARLIELNDKLPPAAHEDPDHARYNDARFDLVRICCGMGNDLTLPRLIRGSRSPELIDWYLSSQRPDQAHQILLQASQQARLTTSSGASVGGNDLAVMGSNPHLRIRLARRAIRLSDFELARKLIDEIPSDDERREAYRAVTLVIAEQFGVERALEWLSETPAGISRSGGNLGLVEFLVRQLEPTDDLPKPWSAAC